MRDLLGANVLNPYICTSSGLRVTAPCVMRFTEESLSTFVTHVLSLSNTRKTLFRYFSVAFAVTVWYSAPRVTQRIA